MDILFTGFEPFGGEEVNPSWEAVNRLPDNIDGARIHKLRLPVEYHNSIRAAQAKFAEINPDAVIMTGQAGGRTRQRGRCDSRRNHPPRRAQCVFFHAAHKGRGARDQ